MAEITGTSIASASENILAYEPYSIFNLIMKAKVGGVVETAVSDTWKRAFDNDTGELIDDSAPYWNAHSYERMPGQWITEYKEGVVINATQAKSLVLRVNPRTGSTGLYKPFGNLNDLDFRATESPYRDSAFPNVSIAKWALFNDNNGGTIGQFRANFNNGSNAFAEWVNGFTGGNTAMLGVRFLKLNDDNTESVISLSSSLIDITGDTHTKDGTNDIVWSSSISQSAGGELSKWEFDIRFLTEYDSGDFIRAELVLKNVVDTTPSNWIVIPKTLNKVWFDSGSISGEVTNLKPEISFNIELLDSGDNVLATGLENSIREITINSADLAKIRLRVSVLDDFDTDVTTGTINLRASTRSQLDTLWAEEVNIESSGDPYFVVGEETFIAPDDNQRTTTYTATISGQFFGGREIYIGVVVTNAPNTYIPEIYKPIKVTYTT